MHTARNNGRCYLNMTATDLLKKSQDTQTALSHFYFLFSQLWRDRGSPAIQNFPFIQDQELSTSIKEKFIQMLLLMLASFFSQSPSCKTERRSLLISFTPCWATTINLSQLPTHNSELSAPCCEHLLAVIVPTTVASLATLCQSYQQS